MVKKILNGCHKSSNNDYIELSVEQNVKAYPSSFSKSIAKLPSLQESSKNSISLAFELRIAPKNYSRTWFCLKMVALLLPAILSD